MKIVPLETVTKLDIPPDRIFEAAKDRCKDGVVIIGYDEDGDFYFASSVADGGTILWLLETAKKNLLSILDEEESK